MTVQPFPVHQANPEFVIIEFFGGDNELSSNIAAEFSEMTRAGAGNVAVLAIADYDNAPARALEVTSRDGVTVLEELGEIDMAKPEVLAHYLARALVTYPPGTRIAIGFWGHGSGIFGEAERTSGPKASLDLRILRARLSRTSTLVQTLSSSIVRLQNMFNDSQSGGLLTTRKAGLMLRDAFDAAERTEPVDLIFSDTCLNGMVEVVAELEGYAHCVIGSEDNEPPYGWDYFQWLSRMATAPPPDADAWARQAVEAMRAGYLDRSVDFPITLSAVRARSRVTGAFADLVTAATAQQQAGFELLKGVLPSTQIFTTKVDSYDLQGFAKNLAAIPQNPTIAQAGAALVDALDDAIVASIALGNVPGAHGLAFWFPFDRTRFQENVTTYRDLEFDRRTGWSTFLGAFR